MNTSIPEKTAFTRYQVFMIAIISILQFTIILDFIVMAPLGAQLMRVLKVTPGQFGAVVSAYALSAGVSGIVAAGFADKFDRKKMLLFFYTGFVIGTFLCGVAPDYQLLLEARIVTGVFGGVLGSISMAIIADLFSMQVRGRVMGFVQMAFAVSQVVGIPLGLFLANRYSWHSPFLLIAGICVIIGLVIAKWMKPVTAHLHVKTEHNAFDHLAKTASNTGYLRAFGATVFMSAGAFLIMPFSSAFLVKNVGIPEENLLFIYMATGFAGLALGPLIGRWSDKIGKYRIFLMGSILGAVMIVIYTHLSITPLWIVIVINIIVFASITSRMIPSQALISGMPELKDRGAFMSINSSIQQMGGGIASVVGGHIILQKANGPLVNFDLLGYATVAAFIICAVLMYFVNRQVLLKTQAAK
jgi:predicted MFS family arabinose efflux permease